MRRRDARLVLATIAVSALVLTVGAATAASSDAQQRIYDFTLEVQVHSAQRGGAAESTSVVALTGTETFVTLKRGATGVAETTLLVDARGMHDGAPALDKHSFAVTISPSGEIRPVRPLTGAVLPIVNLQNEAAREFAGRQVLAGARWVERSDDAGMPVLRSYRATVGGAFASRRVVAIEAAAAGAVVDPDSGATIRSLTSGTMFYYDPVRRELVGASGRSFSATSGSAQGLHVNISVAVSIRLRSATAAPVRSPKPAASPTPGASASPASTGTPVAPSTLPPGLSSTAAPAPSGLSSTAAPPVGSTPVPMGPVTTPAPLPTK